MSLIKKIVSPFVEFEEKTPPPKTVVVPTISRPVPITPVAHSSEYDAFRKKFSDILSDENKRNYPGNDYFEFKVMKDAMISIPQEDLRYKAAFAGWSTGGNQTKEALLSTAKVYLKLVENEINSFEEAYKLEYDQQVIANQKLIDEKTQKVQRMMEEIQILNGEISDLKEANLRNTSHLVSKHDTFMAAGNSQRDEILFEIEKINQYIN